MKETCIGLTQNNKVLKKMQFLLQYSLLKECEFETQYIVCIRRANIIQTCEHQMLPYLSGK